MTATEPDEPTLEQLEDALEDLRAGRCRYPIPPAGITCATELPCPTHGEAYR